MIKFRQKVFNAFDTIFLDTIKGAGIGGSIGGLGAGLGIRFRSKQGPIKKNEETTTITKESIGKSSSGDKINTKTVTTTTIDKNSSGSLKEAIKKNPRIAWTGIGMLCGAALGMLVGIGKVVSNKLNQSRTVNNRLMNGVINILKMQFKEDRDFTRDPKISTNNKMRVCIVISRETNEQQIIVNTAADPKLERILDEVEEFVKTISKTTVTKNLSDKFNDITITTISDKTTPKLIADIASKFIRAHYPVYLVEVG